MLPWAKLCAAYPRIPLSKATIVVYHEKLGRFPIDEIMRAVDHCIETCEFFPAVAELLTEIKALPRPTRAPKLIESKQWDPRVSSLVQDLKKQFEKA